MTIGAIHATVMLASAVVLAVVLALWLVAEQRRAAAEQRADALRAQAVALILGAHRLITIADGHLSAWADETPQAWTLDPEQDRIRLAHSAVWSAKNLTHESAQALRS